MMPVRVYKQLYRCALEAPDGDMLEIGAAHGAASISLGLGLRDANRPFRLFAIEKCEGGSRDAYGSSEVNRRILEGNVARYDLAGHVEILTVDLSHHEVRQSTEGHIRGPLALILHDADGELYRDFMLFYNLLRPGATVIIDDLPVDQAAYRSSMDSARTRKFVKARIYTDHFVGKGLIEPMFQIRHTLFARKPVNIVRDTQFSQAELNVLRESIAKATNHS